MHHIHMLRQIGDQFSAVGTGLLVDLLLVVGQVNVQGTFVGEPLATYVAHHPIRNLVHPLHVSLQLGSIFESCKDSHKQNYLQKRSSYLLI